MVKPPIYMDNQATTAVDPRVLEAMLPYLREDFGNAASRSHVFGWRAEEATELAREQVAAILGAAGKEIVFTSGATESDNLAIKGVVESYASKGDHVISAVTEHPAVLDSCKALERKGVRVSYLPVSPEGLVDPGDVRRAITERTVLITIMMANNEVGVIHPVPEIGQIAHEKGVLFHCDAAQAVGKVPVDVEAMHIDLLSISAHKIYGPKGVGALYVRRKNPRVRLTPIIDGGGHERGMRSGTLNVPGIVGLGKACAIAHQELPEERRRLLGLRERLRQRLWANLSDLRLNGSLEHRLPGNLNLSFAHIPGDSLLAGLKDVAVSSGAACTSANVEPSHVLRAMGVGADMARSSIRFGLGRFNTEEEVDHVADLVIEHVKGLRALSPSSPREVVLEGSQVQT
jgi:cysteine desulfurase